LTLKEDFKKFGDVSLENQKEQLQLLEAGPLIALKGRMEDVTDKIENLVKVTHDLKSAVISGNEGVALKLRDSVEQHEKRIREILDKIEEPIDI
jgi:hypothetical protein